MVAFVLLVHGAEAICSVRQSRQTTASHPTEWPSYTCRNPGAPQAVGPVLVSGPPWGPCGGPTTRVGAIPRPTRWAPGRCKNHCDPHFVGVVSRPRDFFSARRATGETGWRYARHIGHERGRRDRVAALVHRENDHHDEEQSSGEGHGRRDAEHPPHRRARAGAKGDSVSGDGARRQARAAVQHGPIVRCVGGEQRVAGDRSLAGGHEEALGIRRRARLARPCGGEGAAVRGQQDSSQAAEQRGAAAGRGRGSAIDRHCGASARRARHPRRFDHRARGRRG